MPDPTAPFEFRALAGQILTKPRLWPLALGAAWRFRRRDWYRRPPYLPVPPREYMAWRLETAFGDRQAPPSMADLEDYLKWTARMRSHQRES